MLELGLFFSIEGTSRKRVLHLAQEPLFEMWRSACYDWIYFIVVVAVTATKQHFNLTQISKLVSFYRVTQVILFTPSYQQHIHVQYLQEKKAKVVSQQFCYDPGHLIKKRL